MDDTFWQQQDCENAQRDYEERVAKIIAALDELNRIESEQTIAMLRTLSEIRAAFNGLIQKPRGDLW